MPDYKETTVAGTSWQRCNNVNISNPRNATPMVLLSEEVIAQVNGSEFAKTADGISFAFDPALVIPLRDPTTGDLIPDATMTGMDVYVALYSLYILKATERDANN